MAKRAALGKGIDALLGGNNMPSRQEREEEVKESAKVVAEEKSTRKEKDTSAEESASPLSKASALLVPVDAIDPNPNQPRRVFDEELLEQLAASLRTYGLIQPITVRRMRDGRYQLISGERRLRAAKLAGFLELPAYVRDADEQGLMEMALVENLQREDLNPIEIALSFQRLFEEYYYTQEQLAERVGMGRATIANYVRLLKLPDSVQVALQQRELTMGHAKVLLSVEDVGAQEILCRRVIEDDLTIAALEALIKKVQRQKEASASDNEDASTEKKGANEQGYVPEMQRLLQEKLGWGVSVKPGSKGAGKVVISYRSSGERKELMQRLGLLDDE